MNKPIKTTGFNRALLLLLLLLLPLFFQAARAAETPDPALSQNASIVVFGSITNTEEIWDRRSNPLMGRPDVLKEIIWRVQAGRVFKCVSPLTTGSIRVSVKGEKNIIKYKGTTAGTDGIFYLTGEREPFNLVAFSVKTTPGKPRPIPALKKTPRPAPAVERHKTPAPDFPENISGRDIIKSKELQERAVTAIAKKYSMKDASFVSMTSFSGPMPPNGGYVYWGVKGLIKGKWHIWQHGYGSPREGTSLEDPQRYNKCNSPGTMISTPLGAVAIKDLKEGDYVLSAGRTAVIIKKTIRVRAENHRVCRILFDDGTVLEISPSHPLPDGTRIGALTAGGIIDGRKIIRTELIEYEHDYTYDILPDSKTGVYYANGILLASTIGKSH